VARLYANENFPQPIVEALRFDADFERLAQQIHWALEAQPTLTGQLLRVNRPAV
jgi:hypothetical protein